MSADPTDPSDGADDLDDGWDDLGVDDDSSSGAATSGTRAGGAPNIEKPEVDPASKASSRHNRPTPTPDELEEISEAVHGAIASKPSPKPSSIPASEVRRPKIEPAKNVARDKPTAPTLTRPERPVPRTGKGPPRKLSRKFTPFVSDSERRAKEMDERVTRPPPVDEKEYVSSMMGLSDSAPLRRPFERSPGGERATPKSSGAVMPDPPRPSLSSARPTPLRQPIVTTEGSPLDVDELDVSLVEDALDRLGAESIRPAVPKPAASPAGDDDLFGALEGLDAEKTPLLSMPNLAAFEAEYAKEQAARRKAEHDQSDGPSIEVESADLDDLDEELTRETPVPAHVDTFSDAFADLDVASAVESATHSSPPPALSPSDSPDSADDLLLERSAGRVSLPRISDLPLDGFAPAGSAVAQPVIPGAPAVPGEDALTEPIEERFSVGDYSGALVVAEGILEEHPDHPGVLRYIDSCQDMLRQMYLSRLGRGSDVPRVAMAPDQLRWLQLDHRAGFLLSCIDGNCSIDEVMDVSSMPVLEALRTMYELVQEGVIEIEPQDESRADP